MPKSDNSAPAQSAPAQSTETGMKTSAESTSDADAELVIPDDIVPAPIEKIDELVRKGCSRNDITAILKHNFNEGYRDEVDERIALHKREILGRGKKPDEKPEILHSESKVLDDQKQAENVHRADAELSNRASAELNADWGGRFP